MIAPVIDRDLLQDVNRAVESALQACTISGGGIPCDFITPCRRKAFDVQRCRAAIAGNVDAGDTVIFFVDVVGTVVGGPLEPPRLVMPGPRIDGFHSVQRIAECES